MRDVSRRAALAVSAAGAVLFSTQVAAQARPFVERDFVNTPAGQIHIRRAGAGPRVPLYCFHQSPQSSFVYADILPHLAQDRVVVACDTPGFGESFRPATQPTIGDYAGWLANVPKAVGHGPIDVVGMFTGSAIAVEMQRQFPNLIRRMVLIGPALFEEEQRKQMYANAWPTEPEETGAFLQTEWAKVMARYPKSMTFEQKFNLFNEYYRGGMNAIFGERAVNSYDMRAALPGVTVPVLVIEPEGSFGRGEEAASLLKNATYIRATGKFGLGLLQTEPQWVAAQILPFLNA
jgi:pimeloyl-ACP methyl ester carboxylesterase